MLLTDLFAGSAARHADQPAIDIPPGPARQGRVVVTYAELAAMAEAVRRELAPQITGECTVAILLPRTTPWLYAAQLGVLQAGAAHVCLDPSFPPAHVQHVLRDARAVAVVTDARGAATLASAAASDFTPLIVTVPCAIASPSPAIAPAPAWLHARSLAYVIYTSGTTGLQKGVLLEHQGAVNLITQGVARFGLGSSDRVAQGSSAAYDSSIEETWLALASGATLVVLDDETVRLGPDLVPWLRRERVTVICPPPTLLRAMDCRSPHQELPDLRLCYVGGEALPKDLADRWGGALWLENGYGPTECTVTVVRERVQPNQPVSIGTPVPPHTAWVLDERQQPVVDGTPGELCIAGIGLARGYLNAPELTAVRFPTLPNIGRVYRTGDLVQRDPEGRLFYLGRIDAQVKLRGYRMELEAIETVLAGCAGVREVACCVQGEGADRLLAAHVVPADAAAPPAFDGLERAVLAVLPEYMVPARFGLVSALPRTIGGKVDRKALPLLGGEGRSERRAPAVAPTSARQHRVRAAFAAVLGVAPASIDLAADFFALGGDSLRAALLVSRLRRHQGDEHIAVRDVYEAPSVAGLAAVLERASEAAPAAPRSARAPSDVRGHPVLATLVQAVWLLAFLVLTSTLGYVVAFELVPWLFATVDLTVLLLLAPWFASLGVLAYAVVALWLAVLAKELLIGRYQPIAVPVWSSFYVRHWIVQRLVRAVPWSLVSGSEANHAALRALGARIGRRVHIHRGADLLDGGWDLLHIGDDVTLAREVDLGLCQLEDGELIVGAVRLGDGAILETRAGTGADVEVGAGARLRSLSYLPRGARVPVGELWDGVPAERAGRAPDPPPVDVQSRALSPWLYTAFLLAARVLWAPVVALPFTAVVVCTVTILGIDTRALVTWLCVDGPSSHVAWVAIVLALAVLALPLSLLARALALRFTPAVPAGTHSRWSLLYLRAAMRNEILEAAGIWLSGTLFWPWWLRLAGMRIGRDCEVSTILDALPEHVQIGGGSFLADGIYLGVPQQHQGRVTVLATVLGARTFLGNHVVIDAGQRLPDDLLIGVNTIADDARMPGGSAWFGHPAFALPRREVVQVDRRLTHTPGIVRYANRLFWESLRMLLPALPLLLGLWWFDEVGAARDGTALALVVHVSLATLAVGAALAGVVLALKWLLLGRVRPGQHGLWSCWASRWDFHYVVWQQYGRAMLGPLEGTLLLAWYLRAMGMRIGRGVVLGQGFAQVVDPDMLTIEDGATVHAMFQAHSFEDRVLKIDRVRLGKRCTVGQGAVVLYGADIGDGARVMPHSVVMKREVLLPQRDYAGVPTAEVRAIVVGAPSEGRGAEAPASAPSPARDASRDPALDVARGLAVIGMLWLHFVPEPDQGQTTFATLVGASLHLLEGVPAALFLVLAGMAWALQATPVEPARGRALRPAYVGRRCMALAALGVPFWLFVWPTDVLLPMAIMLPLVAWLQRLGYATLLGVGATLLALVPVATALFGGFIASDCLDDGSHLANHQFGWMTLRYFLFDGSYPLLPWLALPLLGAALVLAGYGERARSTRWFWLALPMTVVAWSIGSWAEANAESLGDLAPHLTATWQPTSVPFLLRVSAAAIAVIAGLSWCMQRAGLPRWLHPVACFGRASLTHYVGHIGLVYVALRIAWPAEDWPIAVGIAAALGYLAVAVPLTVWWFRAFRRGPLEGALARCSGKAC